MEHHRDSFSISNNNARLNIDSICDFLARAYWANKRPRDVIERSLEHSLNFGMYHEAKQIGFARVVTDFAVFAYICDVFIHEDYRGQSLGKWLMEAIMTHPDLQGLRRWTLATHDAQGLYKQFGFAEVKNPQNWMEILNPNL